MYKRWKKSGREDLGSEHKVLKHEVQKRLRQTYWAYTEKLVDGGNENPQANKKLFTFIKAKKTDST